MDQVVLSNLQTAFEFLDEQLAAEACRVIYSFEGFRFGRVIEWPGESDIEPHGYVDGWVRVVSELLELPEDWPKMLKLLVPVGASLVGRCLVIEHQSPFARASKTLDELSRLLAEIPDPPEGNWEVDPRGSPGWGRAETYEVGVGIADGSPQGESLILAVADVVDTLAGRARNAT